MLDFKDAIKVVLQHEQGIVIESEGSIYIRSTEGENYCSGYESPDGKISEEVEFGSDLDKAVDYFLSKRQKENHG
ncbi:hypothetical protein KCM76_24885 [Zooshikella marina]|uniref:Uncharacterized protein n=2 Tax=Zooshikella TaxID=202771 RepID=A0A4P9VFZ4_9GAMM|nr:MULTISPECIES: hypothetical protein [Zooshikella]MBU2709255.1 hypothetical protein [Zooshikella ganghwensis]MBU2713836.1 hypothetical protein [Zooshikella harenae]RDH41316.1 hypothetical protein B9G39_29035 [Zooshikella ganghwensis]